MADFLNDGRKPIKEFVEVESGKAMTARNSPRRLLPVASMGASSLLPSWIGFPVMRIFCSGWKRPASTLLPPICRTQTG